MNCEESNIFLKVIADSPKLVEAMIFFTWLIAVFVFLLIFICGAEILYCRLKRK